MMLIEKITLALILIPFMIGIVTIALGNLVIGSALILFSLSLLCYDIFKEMP